MTKYSLVMTPTPCRILGALFLLGRRILRSAFTYYYLHSWIWAYKTANISETVEDRAKVTINGLYKIVHGLSIAATMYDLE